MSRMINTVTGPVSSDALGGVLAHEHFVFGYPGYTGDVSLDAFDRDAFTAEMVKVAETIKGQGINTIVDATANECGRDVELLKDLSIATGLNVICSTGYYYQGESAPAYFMFRSGVGYNVEDEIYQMMKLELTEGVAKTGIKAGVIKLASSAGEITPYEQFFFRAACRLAKEDPGVRIITHTTMGTCLVEQADFFLEHGVNPKQVQIGHFCGCTDVNIQRKVLEKGFYVAFDRITQDLEMMGMPTDDARFTCLVQLLADGYGDMIMLSFDKVQHFLGRSFAEALERLKPLVGRQKWESMGEYVLPELRKRGVSEEQLHRFLYENPAAFYGG